MVMRVLRFVCGVDALGLMQREWSHAAVMNKRSAARPHVDDGLVHELSLVKQHGVILRLMRKLNSRVGTLKG